MINMAQLDEKSETPLYKQLAQVLRSQITSGLYPPNGKIPTEPNLCEQYSISRMTVRLALDELRAGGYIYRKQGKGTFACLPKIEQKLSAFYSFTDEIESMGYTITKNMLNWGTVIAGEMLAEQLQVKSSEKIFAIERILNCNQRPFAVETSYIPVQFCANLTERRVASLGLYKTLDEFGIKPNSASEIYEAVILNQKHQTLLKTAKLAPGFLVHRLSYWNGRPIEYCEGYVNGEMVKYKIALK